MSPSLLRAFRHPFIILSIVVLLLNDHLLKTLTPSWLTGKISDFAGLFFFPFLLGVVLQAFSPRLRNSRLPLQVGFWLTALVFIAIKTIPAANAWAVSLLMHLYGLPVQIALDPTDCLALVVFLPAHQFWRGIERQPALKPPGKATYLILAASSLAALATSCPYPPQITRLAYENGILYAGIGVTNRLDEGGYVLANTDGWDNWRLVMYSTHISNKGSYWLEVFGVEEIKEHPFREPRQMPITACDPADAKTCYEIDGTAQVKESMDGGLSWHTAWQAPSNRENFRQRLLNDALLCVKTPDLATFDLVLVPSETGTTLLVAMGSEGLLVHPVGGGWQAAGVYSDPNDGYYSSEIIPTPFFARNLREAIKASLSEILITLAAGLMTWLFLSIWVRKIFLKKMEMLIDKKNFKIISLPAKIVLVLLLLIPIASLILSPQGAAFILTTIGLAYWIVLLVLVIWHIFTFPRNLSRYFYKLDWFTFLSGVEIFIISWLPFGLWAFGVIQTYTPALILSLILGFSVLVVCVVWLRKRLSLLSSSSQTSDN